MAFTDRYNGSYGQLLTDIIDNIVDSGAMSRAQTELYLKDATITSIEGDVVSIYQKSSFKYEQLKLRLWQPLVNAMNALVGSNCTINLYTGSITEPSAAPNSAESEKEEILKSNPIEKVINGREEKNMADRDISIPIGSNNYTFDTFVVGSSNRFANAAARAVADNLTATENNPLFIYGPSGLGKTHLLWSIINKVRSDNPNAKIMYVKGDDFTNQMIDSIRHDKTEEFRTRYRLADMLLIDDIQFIAGKVSTQEEFFHTFNTLYESKRQIVLTSDRPPHEIKTLENRLQSRFESGLMADIQPPDYELRVAIIRSKLDTLNVKMPDEAVEILAKNLTANIRQIEGAIKKLGMLSLLTGSAVTVSSAMKCVSEFVTTSAEPMENTVTRIFNAVSGTTGISVEDIKSKKRNKEIACARHIAIYLMRNLTNMSLPAIGEEIGRDHSTVMSSIATIERELEEAENGKTSENAAIVQQLMRELKD